MDSSTSAVPAERSLFRKPDVNVEIRKLVGQTISTLDSQTENVNPRSQENDIEQIRSSVARLASSSVAGLERLTSELRELQKLLNSEVHRVQGEIDSALAGIKVISEAIAPWKPPSTGAGGVHAGSPDISK
jgi:hypothetical protein